ncbi:MAG: hypothetical protein AB9903_25485 [Vulcanimicrobiota bacterium]
MTSYRAILDFASQSSLQYQIVCYSHWLSHIYIVAKCYNMSSPPAWLQLPSGSPALLSLRGCLARAFHGLHIDCRHKSLSACLSSASSNSVTTAPRKYAEIAALH